MMWPMKGNQFLRKTIDIGRQWMLSIIQTSDKNTHILMLMFLSKNGLLTVNVNNIDIYKH